jgi:cobalt/nickel transport system ATP-binding protein
MKSPIMILDEPTIGLDPYSRKNLISILKNLNGTKVISSHDLDMIYELCDRIALLNSGEIVKVGKKEEILLGENLLEENYLCVPLSALIKR